MNCYPDTVSSGRGRFGAPVMEPALPILACVIPAAPPGSQDQGLVPAQARPVTEKWIGSFIVETYTCALVALAL